MLEFYNEGQHLIRSDFNSVVAADSVNYLEASFYLRDDFDDDEAVITALFTPIKGGTSYTQILENRKCIVPHEAIKSKGFKVSIYLTKDGKRITTDTVFIPVAKSGYVDNAVPSEPTPTLIPTLTGRQPLNLNEFDSSHPKSLGQILNGTYDITGSGYVCATSHGETDNRIAQVDEGTILYKCNGYAIFVSNGLVYTVDVIGVDKDWTKGVLATKENIEEALNNISIKFDVIYSDSVVNGENVVVCNHTFAEIAEAVLNGNLITAKYNDTPDSSYDLDISMHYFHRSGNSYIGVVYFTGVVYSDTIQVIHNYDENITFDVYSSVLTSDIVQSTGSNTDKVMSQKAATDTFQEKITAGTGININGNTISAKAKYVVTYTEQNNELVCDHSFDEIVAKIDEGYDVTAYTDNGNMAGTEFQFVYYGGSALLFGAIAINQTVSIQHGKDNGEETIQMSVYSLLDTGRYDEEYKTCTFKNVSVSSSAWTGNTGLSQFPYKAEITSLYGISSSDVINIVWKPDANVVAGKLSNYAVAGNNKITVYATESNISATLASIVAFKY